MSQAMLPALVLLALMPGASADPSAADPSGGIDGVEMAQLTIHQRIIIRIPRMPFSRATTDTLPVPIRWEEKKGPKCVAMTQVEGALIAGEDSVDLTMDDGERIRAKFDDNCPSLDFYSGFYVKPTPDGMVCAKRDAFRTRSGASCDINQFRKLVAKRER